MSENGSSSPLQKKRKSDKSIRDESPPTNTKRIKREPQNDIFHDSNSDGGAGFSKQCATLPDLEQDKDKTQHMAVWIQKEKERQRQRDSDLYGWTGLPTNFNELRSLSPERLLQFVLLRLEASATVPVLKAMIWCWQKLVIPEDRAGSIERISTHLYGDQPEDFSRRHTDYKQKTNALREHLTLRKAMDGMAGQELGRKIDEIQCRLDSLLAFRLVVIDIHQGNKRKGSIVRDLMSLSTNFSASSLRLEDAEANYQPFASLLNDIIKKAEAQHLVRIDGIVHKPIYTSKGIATRAYEVFGTSGSLIEFVFLAVSPREENPELYGKLFERGNNWQQLVKTLTNYDGDSRFPKMQPNHHYFAFQNGLYNIDKDEFLPYESNAFRNLAPTVSACKYFASEFKNEEYEWYVRNHGWYAIPTPEVSSIGEAQGWCIEENKWWFAEGGRLLYKTGEKEDWQVVSFNMGRAGTGKSTTLKFWAEFAPINKNGMLNNTVEKVFTLQGVKDCWRWLATDVDDNWNIDPKLFIRMVDGEHITIPIKGTTSISIRWDKHGMIAANRFLGFPNPNGEIDRRIIGHFYNTSVGKKTNSFLVKDMVAKSAGATLKKINLAYREKCALHNTGLLHQSVLPQNMVKFIQEVRTNSNPMDSFMRDGSLVICNPKYFLTYSEWTAEFLKYCVNRNIRRQRQQVGISSLFADTLERFGCRTEADVKKLPVDDETKRPIPRNNLIWIVGCGLVATESKQVNYIPTKEELKELARNEQRGLEAASASGGASTVAYAQGGPPPLPSQQQQLPLPPLPQDRSSVFSRHGDSFPPHVQHWNKFSQSR